jgi:hypothetical protein
LDAWRQTAGRALGARAPWAHFSRRRLLQHGAIAAGSVAGFGLLRPAIAHAASAGPPRPIPGGFDENFNPVASDATFHLFPPGIGFEMSTITDFNGVVGGSETRGTATGSDGSTWDFDADMRFMRGTYVGLDGGRRVGAFGFV